MARAASSLNKPVTLNLYMKKTLLATVVGLLVALGANANTYSDNNPANVWITANDPYIGQFTLDGYNPASETITSAYAEFTFFDLVGSESLKVDLSGDILNNGSFFGTLVRGENVLNAWGILDSTGVLSYTVSLTSSGRLDEFWLTNANLTAQTSDRGNGNNRVPDAGATSLLLALGVAGIVGAKRRLAVAA
jgi:protein with PEP-CTERM/exosortase system signal